MGQTLLTKLELKVMNLLWKEEKAFVKDLLEQWDGDSRPAYNTLSTIVRILEEKGFVGHEAFGRSHRYFPLITQGQYQRKALASMVRNVFSGSVSELVSTLTTQYELSPEDQEDLRKMIEEEEK